MTVDLPKVDLFQSIPVDQFPIDHPLAFLNGLSLDRASPTELSFVATRATEIANQAMVANRLPEMAIMAMLAEVCTLLAETRSELLVPDGHSLTEFTKRLPPDFNPATRN